MRYKVFGRSGLRVSELCLGAMTFGGGSGTMGGGGSTDAESRAVFDVFAEAGGTFIDTAVSYSGGASEALLGDFLAADRDNFVVATKYGNNRDGGLMRSGTSRRNMMLSVELSLKRLRTDRIDLFWLHVWDETAPLDEIMRGFDDLVRSGKVLYVAMSDTPAWQVSRGNMMADLLGMTPLVGVQLEWNLLARTAENDLLPMARALDLGVVAWAPLAAGALARAPEAAAQARRKTGRTLDARELAIVATVQEIAREIGATAAQVSLAALRQLHADAQMIPIVGASRPEQLRDAMGCLEVRLEPAQLARIEAASRPQLAFPHPLLRSELGRQLTAGGQAEVLDNHRRR